jgi:hypothetical protein
MAHTGRRNKYPRLSQGANHDLLLTLLSRHSECGKKSGSGEEQTLKSVAVQADKQVRLAKPQRYGQTNHTPNLLSCHDIIDLQTAPDFLPHSAVHARRTGSLRKRSLQAAAQTEWGCDRLWPTLRRGAHGTARHAGHLLERSREFLFPFPAAESATRATSAG